jgi:hypothetical protein
MRQLEQLTTEADLLGLQLFLEIVLKTVLYSIKKIKIKLEILGKKRKI